jgi:hypothetical protein
MSEFRQRLFAVLLRWTNILGYIVVGSAVVAYSGNGLMELGERAVESRRFVELAINEARRIIEQKENSTA